MDFLNAALLGMSRRVVASILVIFGGAALLAAMASIGLWSHWVGWQKQNLRASRTAAVFVDSIDKNVVEEVLTQVMQVPGVESARVVSPEEFTAFLKQHFPDLAAATAELGDSVIPRTLEIVFPLDSDTFSRQHSADQIKGIKNVTRIDDGADRLGAAIHSLAWLSYGGICLTIGLWLVLLIVCLGHYQSIFYTDSQEIQLIRSFGASKFSIFLPWLLEAVFQSLITGIVVVLSLVFGRGYLTEVYNQFFGSLGYEPFVLENKNFLIVSMAIFLLALVAHVLGGLFALMRGKIA